MPALPESRGEGINVDMLNGLSLFTGIGGIDLALSEWVRPVAYCENDRYAQSVLLSRMAEGKLPIAPIWDDVKTLSGEQFNKRIDIIYGGSPCQGFSVAGLGKGMEDERSGLVFEIFRLTDELKPAFVFLENVPAIRTRGLDRVLQEFTKRGYDCRWTMLSAAEVGANHKRERWFLLAYDNSTGRRLQPEPGKQQEKIDIINNGEKKFMADTASKGLQKHRGKYRLYENSKKGEIIGVCKNVAYAKRKRSQGSREYAKSLYSEENQTRKTDWINNGGQRIQTNWFVEPDVGRVANGVQNRVDRIKCLGNAVVPLQAKTAFERLMGITE
jgi:DNA (cytosine-5)-methyltransferase 1